MSKLLRLSLLLAMAGCGFLAGDDPAEETLAVDLLFVVDNSDSMHDEAIAIVAALDTLEASLADAGVTDWRAGVVTTSVFWDSGRTDGIDPGEAGTLVGGATVDTVEALRTNLVCGAICWDDDMPSAPDYVCGEPGPSVYSEQYLDCMCGEDEWVGNCGAGLEQGLEAVYLTFCRAVEDPPEACYSFPANAADAFGPGDERSNGGLDGDTLVVLFTDEGDGSPRTPTADAALPGDVAEVVDAYAALYAALPHPPRVGVVGPAWDGADPSCLGGAQTWGVDRYQGIALATGGFYEPLTELGDDCSARPMDAIVARIAAAAVE